MWETEWAVKSKVEPVPLPARTEWFSTQFDLERVYVTHWSEHCVECAYPVCYTSCPLYERRGDGNCKRFRNGILRNEDFPGLDGAGYDIQFKRWGKLETQLQYGPATSRTLRVLTTVDRYLLKILNPIARIIAGQKRNRILNIKYNKFRELIIRYLTSLTSSRAMEFDEFVVEAFNPTNRFFRVIVEMIQDQLVVSRNSLPMNPGYNRTSLPFSSLNLDLSRGEGKVDLIMDADYEGRLIFTVLDFVKCRRKAASDAIPMVPVEKIKCVVWDLDNTLWDGILVEDGLDGIHLRPQMVAAIQRLDERGVLHSIASKNDSHSAWHAIIHFGLQDYFLYPSINWGPKSESLRSIAEALNISLDSFAFVDDSEAERQEVSSAWPQVRTLSDQEIDAFLEAFPLQAAVTEESRKRRFSYLTEVQRQRKVAEAGNKDDFLRDCQLVISIFSPHEPADVERCLELLQRTNQINLSTERYSKEKLCELLQDSHHVCIAMRAHDRFGDYGLIGFSAIKLTAYATLHDFVLSCRVVQKRVEEHWLQWLLNFLKARGYPLLHATYIPTKRNKVLLDTMQGVGFERVSSDGSTIILVRKTSDPVAHADIAAIQVQDVVQPTAQSHIET